MNKKKKIISLGIILLLIIIAIILIILLTGKNKKGSANFDFDQALNDVNSIENKTRQVIDSINYVNEIFKSDKFDKNVSDEIDGKVCYKYSDSNSDIYINVLRTIYENPFNNKSNFQIKSTVEGEDLYICKPDCSVKEILIEDVRIKDAKDKDSKIIVLDEKEYNLNKTNDMWKFSEPIVLCSND